MLPLTSPSLSPQRHPPAPAVSLGSPTCRVPRTTSPVGQSHPVPASHAPSGALEKGSMGLGRTREGVIPARGKSFIQPLAEGTYCPGQEGTLCENPGHPVTSWLSWEPWQDIPCLPPSCPQVMVPMLGILAQGGEASPCSSPWSRSGVAPNPHLGGRGGGQPKDVDKQAG